MPIMRTGCLIFVLVLLLYEFFQRAPSSGKGRALLAEAAGRYTYYEDVQNMSLAALTQEDSIRFARQYTRNWIEEGLRYDKMKKNIPDNDKIGKLVEKYRGALIIRTYQQALFNQRLSNEITEEEMYTHYDKHRALFLLKRPLMKGLSIKIPLTASKLNKVRQWHKDESRNAVEYLGKYQMQYEV